MPDFSQMDISEIDEYTKNLKENIEQIKEELKMASKAQKEALNKQRTELEDRLSGKSLTDVKESPQNVEKEGDKG